MALKMQHPAMENMAVPVKGRTDGPAKMEVKEHVTIWKITVVTRLAGHHLSHVLTVVCAVAAVIKRKLFATQVPV